MVNLPNAWDNVFINLHRFLYSPIQWVVKLHVVEQRVARKLTQGVSSQLATRQHFTVYFVAELQVTEDTSLYQLLVNFNHLIPGFLPKFNVAITSQDRLIYLHA